MEASRAQAVFALARLPVLLEHTGSTAVPGLAAKPIIDILAGYSEGAQVQSYVDTLEAAGFGGTISVFATGFGQTPRYATPTPR